MIACSGIVSNEKLTTVAYLADIWKGWKQMKPRAEKRKKLYQLMLKKGYPETFCDEVTRNLNTDWPARIQEKLKLFVTFCAMHIFCRI